MKRLLLTFISPRTYKTISTFLKYYIPPILYDAIDKLLNYKYGWKGNYKTWQAALDNSSGYDSDLILQKVKDATLKVKKGEAVYERDSVLFDEIEYSWPLLSGLMLAAAKRNGELNVLDFGGSLGYNLLPIQKVFG